VNIRRKPACASRNILPGPNPRPLSPRPFVFSSLFGAQTAANSNHSPTSAAFARKSNHSRTYAKTGGWGSYRHSNVSKICRRADILECGGLPPLFGVTQGRQLNCMGGADGIVKAGASSRTPKSAFASTTGGQRGRRGGEIPRPRRSARGAQTALRDPTCHNAARERKSGRSARDDKSRVTSHGPRLTKHGSGVTPSSCGQAEGGDYTS